MLAALEAASAELARHSVPHALIGAGAMAAHGVVRSTDDLDLLVTDRAVLAPGFWDDLPRQGYTVEVRIGDDADPLAGVVRLARPPARALDVVVGRSAWQADLIARSRLHRLGSVEVPVASPADLILLKVFAGGGQDLQDVQALLEAGDREAIEAAVDAELGRLPAEARAAWAALSRPSPRGR